MLPADSREQGYVVPIYRAPADACWYHFLHGNVPGHQIDFIYRAEVPQGALTQQHFSHLARIIKYIEPRAGAPFAFAIGNLSRDDTQHEPGHGGVTLILGHRMKGATDHAGRRDPPFAHGIAAVDRDIDSERLFRAAMAFCRHVLVEPSAEEPRSLSPMYARFTAARHSERVAVVEGYLAGFDDLPNIERSRLTKKWLSRGGPPVKRILIGHAEDAPFEALARCAARIAAMLYRSDVRWTSITTGRDTEISNGVSIRLVPRREAAASDADTLALQLEQVPEEEAAIAAQLFGAVAIDRPHPTIPPGAWRSMSRGAPSEAAPAQAGTGAALAQAEVTPKVDRGGSVDWAEEPAPLVRAPLVALAEGLSASSTEGEASGAMSSEVSSRGVMVTPDEPSREDAERLPIPKGREPLSPKKESSGTSAEGAHRALAQHWRAAMPETSQKDWTDDTDEEELSAEPRPRRRGIGIGLAAAGVAGVLAALVWAASIIASGDGAATVAESQGVRLGIATSRVATAVGSAAALEDQSAAEGAKDGEGHGLSAAQVSAPYAAKRAGDSASRAPRGHQGTGSPWSRRTPPTPAEPNRAFGGRDLLLND
jgi:hypothetical protein